MIRSWKDITLYKYQRIDAINARRDMDDLDKTLFSICELFGMTEHELDAKGAKVADKLGKRVSKIFSEPLDAKPYKNIGQYVIDYDPDNLRAGQFVELMFFNDEKKLIQNAHYILASISRTDYDKNDSSEHKKKADFFQTQSIVKVPGTINQFNKNFAAFNNEFKPLFGIDEQVVGEKAKVDPFNKRYGWTYAVKQVADYKNITLDEAYNIPAREFLNHLGYLKALDKYMVEQSKSNVNGR
jgi:ribosomal protein L31